MSLFHEWLLTRMLNTEDGDFKLQASETLTIFDGGERLRERFW